MTHATTDGPTGIRATAPPLAGNALVAGLLGVAGSAWLISAQLATPDMRLGVLTDASMLSQPSQAGMNMDTGMHVAMPMMGLGVFIATWTIMMVAMMVPSVVPAIWSFDPRVRAPGRSSGAPALFIFGYVLVWGAIGSVAYLIMHLLQSWLPTEGTAAPRVGAALLVAAGVYQLTSFKRACLRRCRSPRAGADAVGLRRAQGYWGALRAGLWQGAYCLGSSWPLMLVLLLVGMMNLAWMSIIAGIIFVEKVLPRGDEVSKVLGWGLAASGILLLAAPRTLPALGGG